MLREGEPEIVGSPEWMDWMLYRCEIGTGWMEKVAVDKTHIEQAKKEISDGWHYRVFKTVADVKLAEAIDALIKAEEERCKAK